MPQQYDVSISKIKKAHPEITEQQINNDFKKMQGLSINDKSMPKYMLDGITEVAKKKEDTPKVTPSVWDALNKPVGPFSMEGTGFSEEEGFPGQVRKRISEYGSHLPEKIGPVPVREPLTEEASALSTLATAPMEMGREFMSPLGIATSTMPELQGAPRLSKLLGRVAGVGFGAQGAKEVITPIQEGENPIDYLGRVLKGSGQALFGIAGAASHESTFNKDKAYDAHLKALQGSGPEFKDLHENLTQSGHLGEIARTTDITKQDTPEMNKTIRSYMNNWEQETIKAANERQAKLNPNATIEGDDIVESLRTLKNPNVDKIFPEWRDEISSEVIRFAGKEIPLKDAPEVLARMNARIAALEDKSLEGKATAERLSGTKKAYDESVKAFRKALYDKYAELGEVGIDRSQREYGQLKEYKDHIYNNIEHAEGIRAKQPRYRDVPFRTLSRHKILGPLALVETITGLGGGRHLG